MDLVEKVRRIAYKLIPSLEINRAMVYSESYTMGFVDLAPKLQACVIESWPEAEKSVIGMTLIQFPSGGQLIVITEGPVEGDGAPVIACLVGPSGTHVNDRRKIEELLAK